MSKDIRTLYCRECGAEVYSNEKRCWNCDAKIKNSILSYILLIVLSLVLVSIIGYMYLVGYDTMYNKGVNKTSKKYEKEIEELNSSHTVELEETYEEGRIYGINQVADEIMEKVKQADWELYRLTVGSSGVLDVTLSQLYKKFKSDPIAFEEEYQNKAVRVSAVVSDVNDGECLVYLSKDKNSSNTLECSMGSFYMDDVANCVEKDKVITVEGFIMCYPASFGIISGRVPQQ